MKITFLVDNKTESTRCAAEWGLSILIDDGKQKILMDQGASPMLLENAKRMGISLEEVDFATISHGHYDHSGGTEAFLKLNKKAKVYVHEHAPRFSCAQGSHNIGLPWTDDFLSENKNRIVYTRGRYQIAEGVFLISEVPRLEGYTPTEKFFIKADGKMVEDTMDHEQTLVIEKDKGLYVFSGCSHQGIVAIVRHIMKLFPNKRIAALIAGMHLYSAQGQERKRVIDEIARMDIDYVFPVHCTGMKAIIEFKIKMGDRVKIATAGRTYELPDL